jgi:uncharacterized protein GlcG (DUF336 family)
MGPTLRPAALVLIAALAAALAGGSVQAQPTPAPPAPPGATTPAPPYGQDVSAVAARRAVEAALAEARRNGWVVAVSVVDTHGELVAFERMDGVQYGSIEVSRQKAWTAARFRRDSKAFADGLAQGRMGSLSFEGVASVEGGVLIVADGRIIGAVGVSGVTSAQDAQCARAGAEAAS